MIYRDNIIDEIRTTNEIIKEEAKIEWTYYVGAAVFGAAIWWWSNDLVALIKGLAFGLGLALYHVHKSNQEILRRLALSNSLLRAIALEHARDTE